MANIRIKDQTTDTALVAGDYVIVDNATEGTRKFDLGQKLADIDDDFTDVRADLKSALRDEDSKIVTIAQNIFTNGTNTYKDTFTVPVTGATNNTKVLDWVSIPTNKQYKIKLTYASTISQFATVYAIDVNGTKTNIRDYPVSGTEYTITASHAEICAFAFYVQSQYVSSATDVTLEVQYSYDANSDSLEANLQDVTEIATQLNRSFYTNPITANDLEEGAITNGTGALVDNVNRERTKDYIIATQGSVITSTIVFNVWEFDLNNKAYVRDNGGWTRSYTVTQDCYIKIMWNRVNPDTGTYWTNDYIIESTIIPTVSMLKSFAFDSNYLAYERTSLTVRSIAHRGDNRIAPECTAPSYIIARKEGFTVMENDIALSEDGEFVMWHDSSLNKLGDMVDINGYLIYTDGTNYYYVSDGSVYTWNGSAYVSSAVSLGSLTRCNGSNYAVNSSGGKIGLNLNVLKRIDFGVYKGETYAGTQILTFSEWVVLCKKLGAEIYVDHKVTYTDTILTSVANIVKKYGMGKYSSWLDISPAHITLLRTIIPDARCGMTNHPNASRIEQYTPYNTGRGFFFDGDAKNGMTEADIQLGLNAGFDVEVWYVDYGTATETTVLNVLRTAVSYGVTGITCDHFKAEDAFKYLLTEY